MHFMKVICRYADIEKGCRFSNQDCNHCRLHDKYNYCEMTICCYTSENSKCVPYQPFKDEIEKILDL
jgi:hypothetical protein